MSALQRISGTVAALSLLAVPVSLSAQRGAAPPAPARTAQALDPVGRLRQAVIVGVSAFQVVIEEADLVDIIKRAATRNLKLGKNIGVITYNDTPFKEILAGGISVLSTDFAQMGETMADMVKKHSREKVKNPFKLILRNSI